MANTRSVKGLAELERFLDTLPLKVERNIARGAMRAAAKTVLPVAQSNIHSISGELAGSLKVGSRSKGGVPTGYVATKHYTARWVEYGTKPHWIRVKESARPGRLTRRGYRTFSIGTLNRMAKRGSLVIGGNFVGQSVVHPGAQGIGFLRRAMDTQATAAVMAAGEYVKVRLATEQGLDTSDIVIGGDQ